MSKVSEVTLFRKVNIFDGENEQLLDDDIIADAEIQKELDQEVVLESEAVIVAAYMDAASALVAAELIDEADLSPVAAIIADVWVVAEEVD